MLKALFNFDYIWDIIIVLCICAIVIACIKYPSAKFFVSTALISIYIGFTLFCAINLFYYSSAHGGIYGTIKGLINPNSIQYNYDNFTVDVENIMLVKDGDTDRYSATCFSSDGFKFDMDKSYMLLVCGTPCQILEYGSDYVMADYTYEFLDTEKQLLLTDTLSLRFSFNDRLSTLKMYTDGGSTAVKYWNSYFNKNKVEFELKAVSNDENVFEDDLIKIEFLTYVVDVSFNGTPPRAYYYFIKSGTTLDNFVPVEYDGLSFVGYSLSKDSSALIDLNNSVFVNDTTIYCVYNSTKTCSITFVSTESTTTSSYSYLTTLYADSFMTRSVCDGENETIYFWSWDNCGQITEEEYSSHSAFIKYSKVSNTLGGENYFIVDKDYTFYEASYVITCLGHSSTTPPTGDSIV